jgi:ketosteroid isomerase-like protein
MNTNQIKLILLFLILCGPLLFLSCSTKQVDRINAIQRAFLFSDIDSAITLYYTDDVIFELGSVVLKGKQELRDGAEWDSVVNSRFSFSDFRMSGDTIFCKCAEENDVSKLQGIEKAYFDPVTFIFEDKKIKYTKWEMTPESGRIDKIAFSTVVEWASLMQPQQLEVLMPDGKFVKNAVTANGWLALTKQWREENQ